MDHTSLFIKMRRYLFLVIFILVLSDLPAQNVFKKILIETSLGDITIVLFEETPMHAENFLDLIKTGIYEDILFHRVINNFMIQTGDPTTRGADKGTLLGTGGPGHTVPAEFHPSLYHKKGALAAARQGDQTNPERASSGSQFYIVQGAVFTEDQLSQMEIRQMHIKFTEDQRQVYTNIGGTPHLDYEYTVFGEVIDGLDVVDKIAAVQTDENNRPLEDISLRMKIIE